jgi:diguanylate cyclase (GGDEF)-like protein/PAS domain S-box-containing protein
VSADGRWLAVDAPLCQLLGQTADDLLGRPVGELLGHDAQRARGRPGWVLPRHGATHTTEDLTVTRRDGTTVEVRLTASAVSGLPEVAWALALTEDTEPAEAPAQIRVSALEVEQVAALVAGRRGAERRARESSYLARLTLDLLRQDTPREMVGRVVDELASVLDAECVACVVGTPTTPAIAWAVAGKPPEPLRRLFAAPFPPDAVGPLLRAMTSASAVYVDEYAASPDRSPALLALRLASVALVPIRAVDEGMAVLVAYRFGAPRSWTAGDRELLEATAAALSQHLERASRLRELQETADYAQTIARVSQLTESEVDPDRAGRVVMAVIAPIAKLDWMALATLERDVIRPRRIWSVDDPVDAADEDVTEGGVRPPWIARCDGISIELGGEQGLPRDELTAGRPLYLDDPDAICRGVPMAQGIGSLALVPTGTFDGAAGDTVVIVARRESRPWSARDRTLLEAAARSVRVVSDRHHTRFVLEQAARRDALTGLRNRRAFDEDLAFELDRARRQEMPLSVVILDVDGLKAVNDTLGHPHGDEMLRGIGDALGRHFRRMDRIYRLGGDEFALLLPVMSPTSRVVLEQRVGQAVREVRAAGFAPVDLSFGMATFPVDAADAAMLVRVADGRMYEVKRGKRGSAAAVFGER